MLLDRCPWYVAGPVLGTLIVALRATVNRPLGALGGYIDLTEHATRPSRLGFSAFLLAGIVIGGALFTVSTGTISPSDLYEGMLPATPTLQLGVLTVAGLAMGIGARTAGGCTSGHGLTGTSLGKVIGLLGGVVFGFTLAWARLTDPRVIRDMLLLKEAHVFLIMGSAVAIAAIGVRLLKATGARSVVTREPISWNVDRPQTRHVAGSMLFAAGWTVAGTCPGPLAAMIGEGRLVGLPVAMGLLAGVTLQRVLVRRNKVEAPAPAVVGF